MIPSMPERHGHDPTRHEKATALWRSSMAGTDGHTTKTYASSSRPTAPHTSTHLDKPPKNLPKLTADGESGAGRVWRRRWHRNQWRSAAAQDRFRREIPHADILTSVGEKSGSSSAKPSARSSLIVLGKSTVN